MFEYIDTKEKLVEACKELKQEKELAIDLECENNLHHYGAYISLIQISSKKKNYIVDILVMKEKELKPLIDVLENSNILKVFHDVDFDFRMLNSKLNCHPKNIFDTQMAAMLLGKEKLGLGDLMDEYFKIKKIKKFQMADWTRRPLTQDMLSYAIGDTTSLLQLKDVLKKELKERLPWAKEEFKAAEKKEWEYTQGGYRSVKGFSGLTDQQRAIAKRLFKFRDQLAKKVDRPIHFVFNNKRLIEFSIKQPQWNKVTGVHPIVRQVSKKIIEEVKKGKTELVVLPEVKRKKFSEADKVKFTLLGEVQEKFGKKLGIAKHLIMNKDQMIEIVVSGKLDSLKEWQKSLVKTHLTNVLGKSS
jgi:ribonuclease D